MENTRFDRDALRDYYGTILQKTEDLKTSACCCTDEMFTPSVKAALAEINDEVLSRFYGCGSPLPPLLEGCTVLDLGCGAGRDAYLASRLTGPTGQVSPYPTIPLSVTISTMVVSNWVITVLDIR